MNIKVFLCKRNAPPSNFYSSTSAEGTRSPFLSNMFEGREEVYIGNSRQFKYIVSQHFRVCIEAYKYGSLIYDFVHKHIG
jgi:hypothetical protein